MIIEEIKQIIPADGSWYACYSIEGKDDQFDKVVLWAVVKVKERVDSGTSGEKYEFFPAVMGVVTVDEEGLQVAEDVANFKCYTQV